MDTALGMYGFGEEAPLRVRRLGDVNWGTLAASTVSLVSTIVGAATSHSTGTAATGGGPGVSCPPGYVFNPATGLCQLSQQSGGGLSIDPTVLLIGGAGLLFVALLAGRR